MKFVKIKDPIFIILLIVVLAIWGIIISRVISYFYDDKESPVEIVKEVKPANILSSKAKTNKIELSYIKLDKDPFVLIPVKKIPKKIVRKRVKVKPQKQLNFIVNGVIINSKSKTLLILDKTNNKTVFLKEGSKYKSIKVLSIKPTEIKISEHNKVRTVRISN